MPRGSTVPDSASQTQALVLLREGELYEFRGEWKQAEDRYRESAESGGGTVALKKLAAVELQRREFEAAAKTIGRLKEENSDSNEVLLLEGILSLRQGDRTTARSIFNRKADSPHGTYGQALVSIGEGDHENAKLSLMKAATMSDTTIQTYSKTLLQAYDEFALFPEGQEIHRATLLAHALALVNECETAITLVTPVTNQEPKYRDGWIVKGFCEFGTERTRESLVSLEQAYNLDPEKPEIQYFLARAHAALGDPQNAVTFLQYAILNGFSPEEDARELLARYAMELGNTDLALEQYGILAEKKQSTLRDFERYIELAITTPNHGLDALASAKKALERWPDNVTALTLAGEAALIAGLPSDAQKYIDTALRIDPTNTRARMGEEAIRKAVSPVQ